MSVLQRAFALLATITAVASLATACLFVADQRQYTMVYGAGKMQRLVQEPGLQAKWPWPMQEVRTLERRAILSTGHTGEQPVAIAQSQRLPLAWYVHWRIADPLPYLQHVGETAEAGSTRLNETVHAALQTELAGATLTQLLSGTQGMEQLQQALKKRLCDAAQQGDWGMQVLDVRLTRLDIDQPAATAVLARMGTELEQTAARIKQEAASAAMAAKTQADSHRDALMAESQRQAQQIRSEGDAQAAQIYAQNQAANPELARFLRALAVYRSSFGEDDVLVIDPASNSFFQNLREGGTQAPSVPTPVTETKP